MRKFVAAIALAAVLPLQASALDCQTAGIHWDGVTPYWLGGEQETGSLRTASVGTFLWVEVDGNLSSVEIPVEATGATVCSDGTVEFASTPAEPVEMPVVFDVTPEEYARFIEPQVFGVH